MLSKCQLHSYQLHAHSVGCKNDFYVFWGHALLYKGYNLVKLDKIP